MAKVGEIICGKYEIIELAGKGGMSKVYRAVDINLKKEWAIKEIIRHTGGEDDRIHIRSAIAEANMMKKLDHPAIPRVVDIIEASDVIYVVMDFIEGKTLEAVLDREKKLPVEKVVEWAKALCEVLAYLHRQTPPIIYRDMKPGNVIITADGNVKLIDFGIAREYKDSDTMDTVCLGTVGYAAPEQTSGVTQTDQRTDIYNLGVTLYQFRRWYPRLPEGLEFIIEKCMHKNPDSRYQSCEELLADLENYNNLDKHGRTKDYYGKRSVWNEVFAGVCSFFVALALLFIVLFLKQKYKDISDYNSSILEAESTLTPEEKQKHYLHAIEVRPGELEPYFGLIMIMGEDEKYEAAEEQVLRPLVEQNLHILEKHEEYAGFAFAMGELYWNYYEYGKTEDRDNLMMRIKSAYRWFADARKYEKDTDEFYARIQSYCAMGNYVQTLVQRPSVAADWGKYEVYRKEARQLMEVASDEKGEKESFLKDYVGSVYKFDEFLTKMMGKYLSEGMQIKVAEMNKEPLELETMRVFIEKNGVVRELVSEQEYTVTEGEKNGEWYTYEYCVNASVFSDEGIYCMEFFSEDKKGNVYQNAHGLNKIEIVFGIDKTPPHIFLIDIAEAGSRMGDKYIVKIMAEDNMALQSVEVYINKELREVTQDGEMFLFEVGKTAEIETITVIAKDAAGNETRRELDEVRTMLERFEDSQATSLCLKTGLRNVFTTNGITIINQAIGSEIMIPQ